MSWRRNDNGESRIRRPNWKEMLVTAGALVPLIGGGIAGIQWLDARYWKRDDGKVQAEALAQHLEDYAQHLADEKAARKETQDKLEEIILRQRQAARAVCLALEQRQKQIDCLCRINELPPEQCP